MPQDNIIIDTEPIENPEYKGGPKRGQWQAMAERPKIASMLLDGYSQEEIARKLNLSQPMISYEKAKIEEEWKKRATFDFHRLRAEQLQRMMLIYREAKEAWEKSKTGKVVKTWKNDPMGPPADKDLDFEDLPPESMQETPSPGDPRYFQHMEWAIERINKFMALDPILKNDDWKNQLPDGMTVEDVERVFVDLIEGEASVIEDD